jgi:hypothetical protein
MSWKDKEGGNMNRLKNFLGNYPMRRILSPTIIFSLFLILLFSCPGWGATYYVKAGGNDSLNGLSDATAWATISKVQSTVTGGDTVYFRSLDTWTSSSDQVLNATIAGVTYDGSTYGSGIRATFQATANLQAVVKVKASNITFRGFNINMNSKVTGGIYIGSYATSSVSNLIVTNCKIHDNADGWVYGIHAAPFYSNVTVSNVIITDNEIYNTAHEGLAIYRSWGATPINAKIDGLIARNNIIHHTGLTGRMTYGDGIYIANDVDNVTIEFNTIYSAYRGLTVLTSQDDRAKNGPLYYGSPNGLIVRYNLLYNNEIGIMMQAGDGMQGDGDFYGNLILNSTSRSISISADELLYTWGTSVFNFYNNTIYNTVGTIPDVQVAEYYRFYGTPTFTFKNNIIYTSNATPLRDKNNYLVHSNNLIFRSSGASDEHVYNGTSYNRSGVTTWEPSAQNTAPNFTGGTLPTGFSGTYGTNMVPNTKYFFISSGNALNNGATLRSPYNGCINGAGLATPLIRTTYDIGAYQYKKPPTPPTGLIIVK